MNTSAALPLPPDASPSEVNMYRINKVTERLAWFALNGNRGEPSEFYNLCLSLSRGIDYALANGEVPTEVHEMPVLMKQISKLAKDEFSEAAIMVLMISIKNACEIGWFQTKESEELVTLADEIGKVYSSLGSLHAGPRSCSSAITTVMEKFYPKKKLGRILVSIYAKPGYGASAVDFHITKSEVLTDKIYLLVAQTDNIETSACLISPQQVNFLLNGKGVSYRTNVQMHPGPQMPTNVTCMLKFGTNLLQAVGQFNGHYAIMVAYMSDTPLPENHVLQDYHQPGVLSVDSDSDIIEGASQISLNCPISFTRIKTPVKGRSCKHFQCFDFDNFINMNSNRPSWRCPHCNQYVCYTDIRLDRNMVEILKNVGENIMEVIVLADGSWKAVLEKDPNVDKMQNKAPNCEKEQAEPRESTYSPGTVDLTTDDDRFETMDFCEVADRKPSQASVHSQFVTSNATSLGMNSTGLNQNGAGTHLENELWSGLYPLHGRSDARMVGISELPVLPDTVSPVFNQESVGRDNSPVVSSVMHNQFSAPNNLQMQMNPMNSVNEYGRSSLVRRNISRTPVAVQALPVQSQALGPQQNSTTNLNNSLLPINSSSTPVSLSSPASVDTSHAILSDTERQQHFSRAPMNVPPVSGVNSPAFQHQTAAKNRAPPINTSVPTQLQNSHRSVYKFSNPHLEQALNTRPAPPQGLNARPAPQQGQNARPLPSTGPSNTPWPHPQQGVQQSGTVNQQARFTAAAAAARQGSSQARTVPTAGAATHSHQARVPQPARQTVSRTDELFSSQSDWAPSGRMRGSIDFSRQLDETITERIIAPTQHQSERPQGPQSVRRNALDVLIMNNRNATAHNHSSSR